MNKFSKNLLVAIITGLVMSKLWLVSESTVIFVFGTLFVQLWLHIMQNKKVTVEMRSSKLEKFAKDMEKFKK
jgi:hypothetical protein